MSQRKDPSRDRGERPIHRRAVLRGALATAAAGLTLTGMSATGRASGPAGHGSSVHQAGNGHTAPADGRDQARPRARVIWIGHM